MYWCTAHPIPPANQFTTPQPIGQLLDVAQNLEFYYRLDAEQPIDRFGKNIGDPILGDALSETYCSHCFTEVTEISIDTYEELLSEALDQAEWVYCLEHDEAIPRHILPLPHNTIPRPCLHLMPHDTHSGW